MPINTPSLVISAINKIFEDLLVKGIIIYLEDILLNSKSWSEHLDHTRKALDRLSRKKLYGNWMECVFGVEKVENLRFKLRMNKLSVDTPELRSAQA